MLYCLASYIVLIALIFAVLFCFCPSDFQAIRSDATSLYAVLQMDSICIGVRAIFLEGAGSILPEKYGAALEK